MNTYKPRTLTPAEQQRFTLLAEHIQTRCATFGEVWEMMAFLLDDPNVWYADADGPHIIWDAPQ